MIKTKIVYLGICISIDTQRVKFWQYCKWTNISRSLLRTVFIRKLLRNFSAATEKASF